MKSPDTTLDKTLDRAGPRDTTLDRRVEPADHPPAPGVAPWFQRVLPVSSALLVVIALAVAVVPALRHQAELSLTRQTRPYVELYFEGPAARAAPAACGRTRAATAVRFAVESHLDTTRPVAYRVEVDPRAPAARTVRRSGDVQVRPGESQHVVEKLPVPARGGYRIEVALPRLGQRLVVHCGGGRG